MAHVQKRGTGRYRVRFRDPDKIERSRTFKKKIDADRFAATVETDIARGTWISPDRQRRLFSEYTELWLSTLDCKPKTRASYESILNRWVTPAFGSLAVGSITWGTIEKFKASMVEENKSAQTIKNALNVLKPILNTAVKDGAIMVSPAANITSPKIPPSKVARFETAEIVAAFAATLDKDAELLVLFSAFTGLRAGECGALRVRDLNLLRGSLTVRESLSEVHGKVIFTSPKNHHMRSVALPPFLRDRLVVSLEGRKVAADPTALVFVSNEGDILRHSNFYNRTFKPAVEAFGLKGFRFHDLRHTCAAMLIADGAHPRAIMERLGHSSITVTLNTYGHLFPGLDEALTDGLEEQFQRAVSGDSRGKAFLASL
jgi:integrase